MKIFATLVTICLVSACSFSASACDEKQINETKLVMSTADGVVGGTTLEHSARNSLVFVVIVAGSGPVDRDGRANGAANTPYFDLAHALACRGIESFRFDKAGVGESQPTDRPGSHASLARQIRDLQSVLHELHTRYATRRIIVVAHSEGSLVVADQPSNGFVDGVILLSLSLIHI